MSMSAIIKSMLNIDYSYISILGKSYLVPDLSHSKRITDELLLSKCEEGDHQSVEKLINNHSANPNTATLSGAKPIHIAALLGHQKIVEFLLKIGVDVDTKLTYFICIKYLNKFKWEVDFGEEQTLLTYAVINGIPELASILIQNNANIKVTDNKGRTLLMYSFKNPNLAKIIGCFIKNSSREEIYQRDENGLTPIHQIIKLRNECPRLWQYVVNAGLNINMTVEQRPEKLFINLVAKDNLDKTVFDLLVKNLGSTHFARPLSFAVYGDVLAKKMELPNEINITAVEILIYMYIRRAFDFSIHPDEVRLMDFIIEKFRYIRAHTKYNGEKSLNEIIKALKKKCLFYGCQKISLYDLLKKSHKDRWEVIKDDCFRQSFNANLKDFRYKSECGLMIKFIYSEIKKLTKRFHLLYSLKKIMFKKIDAWFYLPYDCVEQLIKYLDTDALKEFIDAYSTNDLLSHDSF